MINLLPPNKKKLLRAGRANVLLIRYLWILIALLILLAVFIAIAYIYLAQSEQRAKDTIAENEQQAREYANVKAEAEIFRTNLATAKTILDSQIIYTKMATTISHDIPPGVSIDSLSLDPTTAGTPMQMNAHVKDYQAAIELKKTLQQSTIFQDISFSSVSEASEGGIDVVMNLTISKGVLQS